MDKVACASCGGTGFRSEKLSPFRFVRSESKIANNGENMVMETCPDCIRGWVFQNEKE